VTIAQNATTALIPVTGVAPGTSAINATATNVTVTGATVNVVSTLTITTNSPLPNGKIGVAYSQSVAASGGTTPYTFAIIAGTLPSGLNFNTSTGQITGTPTGAPSSNISLTFKVTDSGVGAAAQTATKPLSLTIVVGDPSSITATGGTPQSALTGAQFAAPLQATAKDVSNNPVPNVTVTFTINTAGNGAAAAFTGGVNTATTNGSGVATSAALTANGTSGSYTVTANVSPALPAAAVFTLSNTGVPDAVIATSGTPQAVFVNAAFPAPLVATVVDAGGTPLAGVTVTFGVNPSGSDAGGTFPGNATFVTAVTNASGVATSPVLTANATGGSFTVIASAPGVDFLKYATFNLANAPIFTNIAPPTLGNVSIGQNLAAQLNVTLPSPAPPGGVKVFVTCLNPSLVLLGGTFAAGTAQVVIPLLEGSTTAVGLFAHSMAASGTVQLSIAANGYGNSTATATLTPSGFVLAGPNGVGASFSTPVGANPALTVFSARLDSSLNFVEVQQLRGPASFSASIGLSSSDTSRGTVSPSSVTINGGDFSANANFQALVASPPNAVITAAAPAGYSTPANLANKLTMTVTPVSMATTPVTVGQNLEETATFSFTPAPAFLTFTITSNDPSKLLLSLTPDAAGQTSISFDTGLSAGHTASPPFYVHGLVNSGSATYTVSASGYPSTPGTVNFAPSAFGLSGPFGLGQGFPTTTGGNNSDLAITSGRVAGSSLIPQVLRGGLTVNVPVVSSNTTVGTITTSPVVVTGGTGFGATQFHPLTAGSSNISITAPSGFGTFSGGSSLTITVTIPSVSPCKNITVGKGLQSICTVILGQAAPTGGSAVTLTSNSPNLKLSLSPTTAGSTSIVVNVPAGATSGTYYVQALTDTGSGTHTASAPGYSSGTGTIPFAPSGVVIYGPFGTNSFFPMIISLAAGPQPFSVSTAVLDPGTLAFSFFQPLAGGANLSVTLTNANSGVGTAPSPVTIAAGSDTVNPLFTPLSVGQTVLSVIKPAAFTQPSDNTTLTIKVNP